MSDHLEQWRKDRAASPAGDRMRAAFRAPFRACQYQGKPAILDTVARVYYFGFRSMRAAQDRAAELNRGM